MMNVDSYHQYAVDCVRKAQREEAPGDRDILLNVALAWVRLAQQTESLGATSVDGQWDDEADANPMEYDVR